MFHFRSREPVHTSSRLLSLDAHCTPNGPVRGRRLTFNSIQVESGVPKEAPYDTSRPWLEGRDNPLDSD